MGVDELRGLSSVMFGNRYRLELVAALALAKSTEGICLTLLAGDRGGMAASVYYPSARSLVAAGLARRVRVTGPERLVLYARRRGPSWKGLRRMMEDLEVDINLRDVARPAGAEPS
jgi:hypothetical protein